ncbi:hypothetical protein P3W45_000240 [Vairimorpha bombi]
MIKSLISNYISKYVTNITPSNISYDIFTKTMNLYNVSLNPNFISNTSSQISHIKYTFSFTAHTLHIHDVVLHIDEIPSFKDANGGNISIHITKMVIYYGKFEIKILEIIDDVIRGVEIFYKNVKIFSINEVSKGSSGCEIKRGCLDFEVFNSLLHTGRNEDSSNVLDSIDNFEMKYRFNVDKINIKKGHICLRNIVVSESKKWKINFRKIKYEDVKLKNIFVSRQLSWVISSEDFYLNYTGSRNFISFNIDGDISDIRINDCIQINSFMINESIQIKDIIIKESENQIENTMPFSISDDWIGKYVDCDIIFDNINVFGDTIDKAIYLVKGNFSNKISSNTGICSGNSCEFVEIKYMDDVFVMNAHNVRIFDPLKLINYLKNEDSSFKIFAKIHDIYIVYQDITIMSNCLQYKHGNVNCDLEVLLGTNYFLEECNLKYNEGLFLIERGCVNISDNIMHTLRNTDYSFLKTSDKSEKFKTNLQHISVNLFNTSNIEIYSGTISDVSCFISKEITKLNVRSVQVDNQEYNTKHPIIFKTTSDNLLNIDIINREIFINVGNFNLNYDGILNKIYFLYRHFNTHSSKISDFEFKSLVINSIQCTVYYKYFANIKLDGMVLDYFKGNLTRLGEILYKYYTNMVNSKLIGIFFRNIRNNIYSKAVYLGYKDDTNLPVPWYTGNTSEHRLRYPMPMRLSISKYDYGLSVSYYIFNKMNNKLKGESFKDGTYATISYKLRKEKDTCLILTNKRLLMSSKLNIKEICLDDISVREWNKYFMIGNIKIEVERNEFITSLCEYLL